MGRSRLRVGARCRFEPPLVTNCKRIVNGTVTGEWSRRTFTEGKFERMDKDAFNKDVFVFVGVCAGKIDENREYEFYVTQYVSPLNKDDADLPGKPVHNVTPVRSVTKK